MLLGNKLTTTDAIRQNLCSCKYFLKNQQTSVQIYENFYEKKFKNESCSDAGESTRGRYKYFVTRRSIGVTGKTYPPARTHPRIRFAWAHEKS